MAGAGLLSEAAARRGQCVAPRPPGGGARGSSLEYTMLLLCSLSALAVAHSAQAPHQRSLALHEDGPEAMTVSWVSPDAYTPSSFGGVSWWQPGQPAAEGAATTHSYTAGWGWNGTIFWGKMTGLVPGAQYMYTVSSNGVTSPISSFRAAPTPNASASVRIAVLADMGTVELFGWTVAEEVIREHTAAPFDLLFIAGDLSYATVDPPKNELQHLWDLWGLQNENFSSTAPWMMTVGNHESTPGSLINASGTFDQQFAAFSARWRMPRNGFDNFYYSVSGEG